MKQDWQTMEAFWNDCRKNPQDPALDLLLRLLLSSDGTVIRYLNALFLSPTSLEVLEQHEIGMDKQSTDLLEVPEGEQALERKVWLCNARSRSPKGRLLYAVSVFPIAKIEVGFYREMRLGKKPLGQIIEEHTLSTRRDKLEVACLPFPGVAQGLGLSEDHLFWARRYRLIISGQLSASIREVFSPRLSSSFS